jgi:hypothetical protein
VVDRLGEQLERRRRQVEVTLRVLGSQTAVCGRSVGQLEQLRSEQRALGDEPLQPLLGRLVEEATVAGDQHRGEDPERVLGQFVGVDRAERGRDDGHRALRRVTQIVEADRMHAEAGEHPGRLGQLER